MHSCKKLLLSGSIFGLLFCSGFFLAGNKPLWKDEYYSVSRSIPGTSYTGILSGSIPLEGNNSPFFYITQKVISDLVGYDARVLKPVHGRPGHFYDKKTGRFASIYLESKDTLYNDLFSNYYFRLIPVFLMALTPAILFYYFSLRFSFWSGWLAVLLCCSSWLFWWYGLEARPYIYILAFSTLQILVTLEMIRNEGKASKLWMWLGVTHMLLALSSVISVVQIIAVGVLFGIYHKRFLNWKRAGTVFVIPLLIGLFYYWRAEKYGYYFLLPLQDYFLNNIPSEVLAIWGAYVLYRYLARRTFMRSFFNNACGESEPVEQAVMLSFIVWCLCYFALVSLLRITMRPVDSKVFYFSHRYLIGLVPVGIVAATLFCRRIVLALRPLWAKSVCLGIIISILLWRFYNFYSQTHYWIGI